MAINNNLTDYLTFLADSIRGYLGYTYKINPQDFPYQLYLIDSNAQIRGYVSGIDEGKKSEYDLFWDNFQANGTRVNYQYAFSCDPSLGGWNDNNFKPKYDIVSSNTTYDFNSLFQYSHIKDIDGCLKRSNVRIDSSLCLRLNNTFDRSLVEYAPILDCTNAEAMSMTCYSATKLIRCGFTNISSACTFDRTFNYCYELVDVSLTGTIGQNGLTFSNSSKLSKASFTNIINCLSDTTSGLSITFSNQAKQKVFTQEEWTTLIARKPNWTIVLV